MRIRLTKDGDRVITAEAIFDCQSNEGSHDLDLAYVLAKNDYVWKYHSREFRKEDGQLICNLEDYVYGIDRRQSQQTIEECIKGKAEDLQKELRSAMSEFFRMKKLIDLLASEVMPAFR